PKAEAHQVGPAGILRSLRYESAEGLGGPGGLALGQVRQAQELVGLDHFRLPRYEAIQLLDGGLRCTGLDVQLSQQEHGLAEVGRNRARLLELGLGLLEAPALELGQSELVVRLRGPRLELHGPLKILDRRGHLALGEMHSSTEQKSVQIRGALLED